MANQRRALRNDMTPNRWSGLQRVCTCDTRPRFSAQTHAMAAKTPNTTMPVRNEVCWIWLSLKLGSYYQEFSYKGKQDNGHRGDSRDTGRQTRRTFHRNVY